MDLSFRKKQESLEGLGGITGNDKAVYSITIIVLKRAVKQKINN